MRLLFLPGQLARQTVSQPAGPSLGRGKRHFALIIARAFSARSLDTVYPIAVALS